MTDRGGEAGDARGVPADTAAPLATLAYAGLSSPDALPASIRAMPLLAPNLMSVGVLFLPLYGSEPPIGPVADYARLLFMRAPPGTPQTLEAMITGPFLLAIPLAVWTLRLALAPPPRPVERWIAWSLTLVSMTMTLLCLGYCAFGPDRRRFMYATAATVIVTALCGAGIGMIWRLRRAWPAALLAMTGAWAINTTLTMFVVLSHAPWTFGIRLGLVVVAAQLIVGYVCVRRWRATTSAAASSG